MNESASGTPGRPRDDALRIEPATIDDLPDLTRLVMELFEASGDFMPEESIQQRGLQLVLEQPNRGRIFVLRNDDHLIGMVNVLFTISTAMGGFVIVMEDLVVHPDHRGRGFGGMLLRHVIEFARQKDFKRITLLTDKISAESQDFFRKAGFDYSNMLPMRMVLEG